MLLAMFAGAFGRVRWPRRIVALWFLIILSGTNVRAQSLVPTSHDRYSDEAVKELEQHLQASPSLNDLTQAAAIISGHAASPQALRDLISSFEECLENENSQVTAWTALSKFPCPEFHELLIGQLEKDSNWVHPELFLADSRTGSREDFYRLAEIATAPSVTMPTGFSDRQPVWDAMFAIDPVQATSIALQAFGSYLQANPGTPTAGEHPFFVETSPPTYMQEIRPIPLTLLETKLDALLANDDSAALIAPSIARFLFSGTAPSIPLVVAFKNGERRQLLTRIEEDLIARNTPVAEALLLFYCDVDDAALAASAEQADYGALIRSPWILNHINWTKFLFTNPHRGPSIPQSTPQWLPKARAKLIALHLQSPVGTERFALPSILPIAQAQPANDPFPTISVSPATPLLQEENADYKSLVMSFGHYFGGTGWAPPNDYDWNAVAIPQSEDELEDYAFLNAAEIPMTPPPPGVRMFDPSFMDQSAAFVVNQELTRRALLAYAVSIHRSQDGEQPQPLTMASLDEVVQNMLPSVHSCVTQVVDKLPETRALDTSAPSLPGPGPYRVAVQERFLSFAHNAYLERVKIIGSSGASISAEWVGSIPNYLNLALRSTPRFLDLIGFSLFADDISTQLHPQQTETSNLFLVAADGPFALRLLLIQSRYSSLSWPVIRTILETDVAERKATAFSPQLSLSAQATKLRSTVDVLSPDLTNANAAQDEHTYSGYRAKLFQKFFEYFYARETLRFANALVGPVNTLPNTVDASQPIFGLNFTTGWFGGGHQNGQKVILAGKVTDLQNQAKALFSKYPGPTPNTSELSDWDFTPKHGVPYLLVASTCSISGDANKALLYVAIAHFGTEVYETVAEVDTKITDDVREKLLRTLRIDPYWLTRNHITFLDSTATEPEAFASLITRIGDYNSRLALLQDNADRSGMSPVFIQDWYLKRESLSTAFPSATSESVSLRSYLTAFLSAAEYVQGSDPPAQSDLNESFLGQLSGNFLQYASAFDQKTDDNARPVIDAINAAKNPPSNQGWQVGITYNAPGPYVGVELQINGLGFNLSFTDLASNLNYSLLTTWNGMPLPLIVSGALGEPPAVVNDYRGLGESSTLGYMSLQGGTVDVSSIASIGRRATTGSLVEASSMGKASDSDSSPQSISTVMAPRPIQSTIANPITGSVQVPRNIGQFSYDGSTWYVSLKPNDAGFEVWARATENDYSARDRRLFTISVGQMSEIATFACSAKEQLEKDKTLVGCAVSSGAFAYCAIDRRMCRESLEVALDGPLAACIEGIKDLIASKIVRDPLFSALKVTGAIQDKDWINAISATMDLICQHYKDTPNGHALDSSGATDYGEMIWMWGEYYQQYSLLTSQQRKQIADVLIAGVIPSEVKDLLLKNSSSSSTDQEFQWQTEIVPELVPAKLTQPNSSKELDNYINDFNGRSQKAFDLDCSAVESRPFVEAFANAGIPVTRLYVGNDSSVLGFEDDYFLRDGRMIRRMVLARTPDVILPLMRTYPGEHVFERVQLASLLSAMSGHEVLPEITPSESMEKQFIESTHGDEIKAAATKFGTVYADSLMKALEEYIDAVTAREEKLAEPTNGGVQPIVLSELQRVVYDVIPTPYKELSVVWNQLDDEMKSERAQSWAKDLEVGSGAVLQEDSLIGGEHDESTSKVVKRFALVKLFDPFARFARSVTASANPGAKALPALGQDSGFRSDHRSSGNHCDCRLDFAFPRSRLSLDIEMPTRGRNRMSNDMSA
jgi:hypothetical protein